MSCHGMMKNKNYMLLNETDIIFRCFDFENRVTVLAKVYKNCFFLIVYDCCREAFTAEYAELCNAKKKSNQVAGKGFGDEN